MSIGFSDFFRFETSLLAKSLYFFDKKPELSKNQLSNLLGIGPPKAKSQKRWLEMLGLKDKNKGRLTFLGNLILEYDSYFTNNFTQWIFHYQLASNPEAEVWYSLSNEFLPGQTWFSFYDAINFLESKGLRSKNDKHLRSDVSIFLRSFTSVDALGKTGYLKIGGDLIRIVSRNKFYKNPPLDISPYLIAYIIFNQREQKFPNFATITIEELLTLEGNVGKVLSLNRKKLEEILKLLSGTQYDQLVDLSTRAGLDQVGFRFRGDSLEILKMYYSKEENV